MVSIPDVMVVVDDRRARHDPPGRCAGSRSWLSATTVSGAANVVEVDATVGRLRAAGLAVTTSRRAVLRVLAGREGTDSAAQVYDLLRAGGARFGLTGVYRVLLAFDRVGLVHVFDGAERRFRLCGPAPHTHLMCTVCGQVCEVPADVARGWLEPARLAVDFVVDPLRSDLYGRCGRCGPTT